MKIQLTFPLIGLLTWCFLGQCQTNADYKPVKTISSETRMGTIIKLLKNKGSLSYQDILQLDLNDTANSFASMKTGYSDTAVQLNDDIFYSIISLPDTDGVCSYSFIVTIDEKNKKPVDSKYLMPDCDIDVSADSYTLYRYQILSKNVIDKIESVIYQKKNRTSDEEKNIERKETTHSHFIIQSTGLIVRTDDK